MGNMGAMGVADAVNDGLVDLYGALHWHLTSNHYPPLPVELIEVARKAIELASEAWSYDSTVVVGEHKIDLPDGIVFRNRDYITVAEAVESMHLDAFLACDEDNE